MVHKFGKKEFKEMLGESPAPVRSWMNAFLDAFEYLDKRITKLEKTREET